MIVKVKKVWKGHVSVRDYVVKKAIDAKEDLIIDLFGIGHQMYPYKSLKGYLNNTSNTKFASKFGGQDYKLIDFPWKSQEE